jgi:regulator of RNase E activity RraA
MQKIGEQREKIRGLLYSAVLSDVMDSLGFMHQAMRPFVRPLDDSVVLFGRARTGLYMNRFEVKADENPYETEIAFMDDLRPGDVAVLACDGPTDRIAPWGELLTTAARARGAEGCVTDGLVRDIRRIRALQFPVFHGGIGPLDSRGRAKMMDRDCRVSCGGVPLRAGDWIFGDADGVVVVPEEIASEIFAKSVEKVSAENKSREDLAAGRLLREVFEEYGVL